MNSQTDHSNVQIKKQPSVPGTYKILFLEDNVDDVELMLHELHEAKLNFEWKHAERKQDFFERLNDFHPDIILADYSLPSFNGMQAFKAVKDKGIEVPFVLVTGMISEQMAIEFLNEGVDDFILKSSFKRLPAAIVGATSKKKIELEKRHIESQLKKSHTELKSLLNNQQAAREEERKIIARDLHDELGQIMTRLKIDVTMVQRKVNRLNTSDEIEMEFEEIKQTIDRITQSVKRISSGLRPETIDELGFIESIKIQCEEFEKKTGIRCIVDLPPSLHLNNDMSLALYRIVQEGLTNVVRHAKATRVNIKIKVERLVLSLEIRDNGIGIPDEVGSSSKSLGLIGLRERVDILNGTFKIQGYKNKGTLISIAIPINPSTSTI